MMRRPPRSTRFPLTVLVRYGHRLSVLKVCIWEVLTLFYNPQLGIPFNFVPKEIGGLEVR